MTRAVLMRWRIGIPLLAALGVLLGLTIYGVVYAATPSTFMTNTLHDNPIGIVSTINRLVLTEYCVPAGGVSVYEVDSAGTVVNEFDSIRPGGGCLEEYVDISPGLGGFPLGHVYVTQGKDIYEFTPGGSSLGVFASVPTAGADHTGITFDREGTFGNKMIITATTGHVYTVDSSGAVTLLAQIPELTSAALATGNDAFHENPEVIPEGFGPLGGQIWTAAEHIDTVWAISPTGDVEEVGKSDIYFDGAETVHLIPSTVCNFGSSGGAFFINDTFNALGGGRVVKF
ncbi:MAG: hypothetical protein IIC80_10580, partial [Chloroflexi bacterium]|nr:hypothetical protein [Chloroflexota bacterium]